MTTTSLKPPSGHSRAAVQRKKSLRGENRTPGSGRDNWDSTFTQPNSSAFCMQIVTYRLPPQSESEFKDFLPWPKREQRGL